MFNDRELLALEWAVSCHLYSPSFFAVDTSFSAVWLRLFRSLDVSGMGYERYWATLQWLCAASDLLNGGQK